MYVNIPRSSAYVKLSPFPGNCGLKGPEYFTSPYSLLKMVADADSVRWARVTRCFLDRHKEWPVSSLYNKLPPSPQSLPLQVQMRRDAFALFEVEAKLFTLSECTPKFASDRDGGGGVGTGMGTATTCVFVIINVNVSSTV